MDVLLRLEQHIRRDMNENRICLVVYVDFASAFDLVWGDGLTYKLICLGLKGKMLGIIDNFFKERVISVILNNNLSQNKSITAGTPQGSALSPTLFNLMLSDLPEHQNITLYS